MAAKTSMKLDDIRARLMQRKQHLAGEIEDVRNQLAEALDHQAEETRDGGASDAQTGVDHAMVTRDVHEIRDIDAALARIAGGDYGTCIDCGDEIEPGRLAVYPTAKRCLPCQVKRERDKAVNGKR